MTFDIEIKIAGYPITIYKGNNTTVSTYMHYGNLGRVSGKNRAVAGEMYEYGYYLPSDSGISAGDLIYGGSVYYLVMGVAAILYEGEVACYRGSLFGCNASVTIIGYNPTTKTPDYVVKSGVNCLITQQQIRDISEDMPIINTKYKGGVIPYYIYLRTLEGLTDKCVAVVDSNKRRYRVGKDFNYYFAPNITTTQLILEDK